MASVSTRIIVREVTRTARRVLQPVFGPSCVGTALADAVARNRAAPPDLGHGTRAA